MKSLSAMLFAIVLLLCGFVGGCRPGDLRIVDHPRAFYGVRMEDVTLWSAALHRNMMYRVYLPANLDPAHKLPVVYLLHGGGGGYKDWSSYSDVGQYAARGYLLVMPEGESSYYMNEALAPSQRYQDYLTKDVFADVDRRFSVAAGREHRAVIGVSMGGFAAVDLALAHPELLAFAGAISPAVDVPSRKFSWRRFSQSMRFRRIFGPDGSTSRRAADPFLLIRTAVPAATPYLYITAGTGEPLRDPVQRLAVALQHRGFATEFHTKPGGHDWNEWNAQIPDCFTSLFEQVSGAAQK